MKIKLALIMLLWALPNFAQLDGLWYTNFTVFGNANSIQLEVLDTLGERQCLLTDMHTNAYQTVKMEQVLVSDSSISFSWKQINLVFKGNYDALGDSISGTMLQSGTSWPVNFVREKRALIPPYRPQEPTGEITYSAEEITIKNGDIQLGATLTLPQIGAENCPIVVLASGSGPQDRNSELAGHKPFLVIADYLAKNGIGCLRFDDRGTGSSTGVYAQADLKDFASDVRACVSYLSSNARFDNNKIGLAGHSEGGMHVLMAAKRNKNVNFVIQLASVGTSGRDVLVEQQYLIPLKSGESEEQAKWNSETYAGIADIILRTSATTAIEPLNLFLDKHYDLAPASFKETTNLLVFKMNTILLFNTDWARQFLAFTTADYLANLRVPVLILQGGEDIQVPPISATNGFQKSAKTNHTMHVLDGLNHLFQRCTVCDVMEYGNLEETFSDRALQIMIEWVLSL